MNNILIVVAHPDDAEFGMGGTIAKLSVQNKITLCVLCKGNRPGGDLTVLEQRKEALIKNIKILGISELIHLSYDDVSLDSLSHLTLTKKLNDIFLKVKPNMVFTNYSNDVHIDHQLVSKAVRVVCRPRSGSSINSLYEFSIPGSGEWNFQSINYNTFFDISNYTNEKYKTILNYKTELKKFPDPLSIEKIKNRDMYYGGIIGSNRAEPFICIFNKK